MFLLLVLVQAVYPNNLTAPETIPILLEQTVSNEELLHKILVASAACDFVYVALLEDT